MVEGGDGPEEAALSVPLAGIINSQSLSRNRTEKRMLRENRTGRHCEVAGFLESVGIRKRQVNSFGETDPHYFPGVLGVDMVRRMKIHRKSLVDWRFVVRHRCVESCVKT